MAKRILAVDDEKHIVRLIQVNLERAGYAVQVASDGVEALELVARSAPDLIVLDWMMPHLNGMAVLQRLKSNPVTADIPVVMLTARADDRNVLEGWGSGVDCYLTKPFNPMELLSFIQRILEDRDREDEGEERRLVL